MRIIVICGAGYLSGKEKIMLSLLKGFIREGDEVYCITSSWGNGQFEELLVLEKIKYSKIRLGFISKTFNWSAFKMTVNQLIHWPKLLYNYRKIISGFKPDIVIHTNFHHTFLLYPVINRNKYVNIYHSHESVATTKFYKWLFLLFEKKMRLFVGVSQYVTDKLKSLGISGNKLKTIYNGVEIVNRIPEPLQTGDIFKIGIIGQVGAWKGHEDLLHAIHILKTNHPALKFKLYIFGDGKKGFVTEMRELVDKNQLHSVVEWKGFEKDIYCIYSELQLVCVPSRSEEPFATSALEAGLFGIPIIVTRRGGFPEIVRQGYNGYIVEANSPAEIAGYLCHLIKNPGHAMQMGFNHKGLIKESFAYDIFINNWRGALAAIV